MLSIKAIASYLPSQKISNREKMSKFDLNDEFIENTIGVIEHARKSNDEETSDLCVSAFVNLTQQSAINVSDIDCCIVVTQNPDYQLPHTSAIVHKKLGLSKSCACFDVSLGCSGYVYGLSTIMAFMSANNLKNGLLFTADPYSKIVDDDDKNTALIFGDGATVTLINDNGDWQAIGYDFGTDGSGYQDLICTDKLFMNGRSVFTFAASVIPPHIKNLMIKYNFEDNDIDKYVLHQGSKYIVDTIRKRLKVNESKVPFVMYNYGNTVSSSIPLILEQELQNPDNKRLIATGFGVGLSWASVILEKVER